MIKLFDISRIGLAVIYSWRPRIVANKRRSLKILFLVRRYHTNMITMIESLQQAGHTVAILVSEKEIIENYDLLIPAEISNPFNLQKTCAGLPFDSPDLVILRERSEPMIRIALHFREKGAKLIHYEQHKLRREKGLKSIIKDLKRLRSKQLKGIPLHQITPVEYEDDRIAKKPLKFLTQKFAFPILPNSSAESIGIKHSSSKPIEVLMIGKMAQPRKRHFWLIQALESCSVKSRLTICGAGNDLKNDDGTRSLEYYNKLHERSKSASALQVMLKENLDYYELKEYYRSAEIVALPAEAELFGISTLEAMASGCAVITADTNGSAHHITHGRDGLIFKEYDYPEFETQVHQLLEDAVLRRSLQTEAKKTIQNNHNYEQYARFIESFYHRNFEFLGYDKIKRR